MGNTIAKSITSGILAAKGDSKRTLKISTKGIPDFNGNQDTWTKWKTSALNTFIAGGYKEILECYVHSADHETDNEVVYTLLAGATINGTARHVVAKHDSTKDGHMAWQELCYLFDGESRLLTTAKRLREKLQTTCLYAASNSDRYLDSFLETYRDLESHGGHMSEPEAIGLFLDNIHDPDYYSWKTAIKLHKLSLDEHVLQFRERADDINATRTNRKRLRQHIRRLAGKHVTSSPDSDSETETTAPKKVRRQKVRRNGVKESKLTEKGLVSIPAKEWYDDLDETERDYIQAYNAKVKHNKSTIDLTPPTKLKLVRRNGTKVATKLIEDEKKGEDESSDSETEETTLKTDRKKIRFNLKARDVKN